MTGGPLDTFDFRPEGRARPDAPQADTRDAPSMGELAGASWRTSADESATVQASRLDSAYSPIVQALAERTGRSQTSYARGWGSYIANQINPFADASNWNVDEIWRGVAAERKRDPEAFKALGNDRDEFERKLLSREGRSQADDAVLARSQGTSGFVAQIGGGMLPAMADVPNVAAMAIGAGPGAAAWKAVLTEGLANAAVEAAQLPGTIERRGRMGKETTIEDMAMRLGFAFVGGAAIRGGVEAAPRIDAAGVRALAPVRQAIDRSLADRDLARAFARSVPDHLRTPDEAAALHTALRQFEIDDASPFQRTYDGIDAHAAKLADAMAALDAGKIAVERPAIPLAPLTPSARVSGTSGDPARSSSTLPSGRLHGGIVSYLRQAGLPEHLARGIAAGVEAESRSSHTIVNPTSGAFGIGQWLGPRKKALFQRYGTNPSLQQQLEFLVWELRGGDHGGKSVLGAADEAEALRRYIVDFMRPAAGAETSGDLSRGMAALGRGEESLPIGGRATDDALTTADDGSLDAALAAEAADMDARRGAIDEPLTPQGPRLRRDGFASESHYRIAQAEADAEFAGIDPAADLLYRLRQVVVVRDGRRSLNRADDLAAELGTTPAALREGLDRLTELGEIQKRKDGRYGRLATGTGRGERTLVEWIADRGGIEDAGGEIAHMGGETWHRGAVGRPRLIRATAERGGMFADGGRENTAEALFEGAISDGYFPELDGRLGGDTDIAAAKPDLAIFYAAIARELGGDPVRSMLYAEKGALETVARRGRFQGEEHYAIERAAYDAAANRVFGRDLDESEFLEAWDGPGDELPGRDFAPQEDYLDAKLASWANRKFDAILDDAWAQAEKDVYDLHAWDIENAARGEGEAPRDGGAGSGPDGGDPGPGGRGGEARPRDAQENQLDGSSADRADEFGLRGDPVSDPGSGPGQAMRLPSFDDDAGDGVRAAAESAWHDIRAAEQATDAGLSGKFDLEELGLKGTAAEIRAVLDGEQSGLDAIRSCLK